MLHAVGVDLLHEHVQAFVHVGVAPGQAQCVLAHFQAGGGDAAGVARIGQGAGRVWCLGYAASRRGISVHELSGGAFCRRSGVANGA